MLAALSPGPGPWLPVLSLPGPGDASRALRQESGNQRCLLVDPEDSGPETAALWVRKSVQTTRQLGTKSNNRKSCLGICPDAQERPCRALLAFEVPHLSDRPAQPCRGSVVILVTALLPSTHLPASPTHTHAQSQRLATRCPQNATWWDVHPERTSLGPSGRDWTS